MKKLMAYLLMGLALGMPPCVRADSGSALGDWGHYVWFTPVACFNNPAGVPFTITVYVMRQANPDWNRDDINLRLTGPDGKVVDDGPRKLKDYTVTVEVKEAAKGVYRLYTDRFSVWYESSLPQAVIRAGDPGENVYGGGPYYDRRGPAFWHAFAPRRWWFWVPAEVTTFTAEAMRDPNGMSQREDWGFFIISPRGQRIRALWGQPPNRSHASGEYKQVQRTEVEVEPGAGGRFWCLKVGNGDSHHHSKINMAFTGIPPWLARSPEEWFDPDTGKAPTVPVYDETPFMQSTPLGGIGVGLAQLHAMIKDPAITLSAEQRELQKRWPGLEHWSPCPSLGDPDGNQILGDGTYALWNPEGRELQFHMGCYIPRWGKDDKPELAAVTISGADGATVLDREMPVLHIHDPRNSTNATIRTGAGMARVSITGAERWMSFTHPAMPMVLIGEGNGGKDEAGWKRFRFTASAPRNWYFFVPTGVRAFSVRFATDFPSDMLMMEVCAPDRTVALFYGGKGEQTIVVPDGLDGRIWYVRPSVGSATRIINTVGARARYPEDSPLTLDLKGVPGYLAPTWEQWFDPDDPRSAGARSRL